MMRIPSEPSLLWATSKPHGQASTLFPVDPVSFGWSSSEITAVPDRPQSSHLISDVHRSRSVILAICALAHDNSRALTHVLTPHRDHFTRALNVGEANMPTTYLPRVNAADHEVLRRVVGNYPADSYEKWLY